jgi:hypothetical protein
VPQSAFSRVTLLPLAARYKSVRGCSDEWHTKKARYGANGYFTKQKLDFKAKPVQRAGLSEIVENSYGCIASWYSKRRYSQSDRKGLADFARRLPRGAKILDAGCGSACASSYLSRRAVRSHWDRHIERNVGDCREESSPSDLPQDGHAKNGLPFEVIR